MESIELTKDVKCISIKISLLIKLLTKKDVSQTHMDFSTASNAYLTITARNISIQRKRISAIL